ncbi:MAG: hypothetical protein D6763_05190 [Alphaproteobacteria bacterium]|nr:MAG: hypothetical protein D6763_05190 [Alphaproteobacteria bacterium]
MNQINPTFTAIVLAGQRSGVDPVANARGVTYKALAPVGGRPMILNVIEALEACPWVDRVIVSLEDRKLAEQEPGLKAYQKLGQIADAGPSICTSVAAAVRQKNIQAPFLVVTADHALLTPAMLNRFCEESVHLHKTETVDFTLAMVARTTFQAAYPMARRTFLNFRDDGYSGCNMFAFMTITALRVLDFWVRIERDRKKPWRLMRAFGLMNLFRYLFRLEDLQSMIARGGKVVGVVGRAVVMDCPEAAIDVDTIEDLDLVERILATRRHINYAAEPTS